MPQAVELDWLSERTLADRDLEGAAPTHAAGGSGGDLAQGRGLRPVCAGVTPTPEPAVGLTRHFRAMARNNAWANERLLGACAQLDGPAFAAPRMSFFPSLRATLNHNLAVDLYYLDALEGGGRGRAIFATAPDIAMPAALRTAQARVDHRLMAFCDGLGDPDLARRVPTDRGRPVPERIDDLLAHLFQHQIHHRGQAHAMLAGTGVAPPQLDEFFLDYDRHPSVGANGYWPIPS